MPNSSRSNGVRGITDRDPSFPRETIESMATEAEQLYNWILIANEARERLDLPVGTIEEAIATLQTAFGASYLGSLIPSDQEPGKRVVTARDDKPLSYWLAGPGIDASVVQLIETATVLRSFLSDPALPKKIERIKTDTFWPTFYELAMAFRVKRALQGPGSLELSAEIQDNNGDFVVNIDGWRLLCECARVTRIPPSEEGLRVTQDIFDYVADKIRPYERLCCVKIRINAELRRAQFNLILQLLKRALERHERTGETGLFSSQQEVDVEVETLTEQSEKIPFEVIDGHAVDRTGSEWTHAHSIGGVAGKTSAEVSEMFRAGIEYDYRERGRVFIKYTPYATSEDPLARLANKIHVKVSQTKTASGTRTAKFIFIDSPYDLRTLDQEELKRLAVKEMSRSSHTLGVAITHREGSVHFRHYYSVLGVLNRDGIRDFPDFTEVLERFRQMEVSTDPITGWKYQRTWEEAQVRSEREIRELERLRRSNIAGYNDVCK